MVQFVTILAALASLGASTVFAAPSGGVTIKIQNKCGNKLQVNQMTNGGGSQSVSVAAGGSTTFNVAPNWGGRVWAREGCDGGADCDAGAPASLAEFLFKGANGEDYYDVSFVDGYNLPISISPNGQSGNGYSCGSPTCASLPECPSELQHTGAGGSSCKSACSAFGTDEYCCTGAAGRGVCTDNAYSSKVKAVCPDVYTYANDDSSSMYACKSDGYTVTFCP
ncbi:thaumatin [Mycotypha africana]|uniref:thaumatin n=1 Tax=Mycotypha africana TaxID=64632 RepID=UPI002300EEBF|nr:thaumatin [Mycotypha africana]KAI8977291.1 thaumatin [Mycotypha africana]